MRVLLLSAYDALSHRYWCEALQEQFPDIHWTVLALAPRHFSYRMRGNPLSWYSTQRATLQRSYDRVIATSMVDAACLRGLFPQLAATPLWLYCHENQFCYPQSRHQLDAQQQQNRLQAQMVFLYNCLCAESISFNSNYNRDTALAGLRDLLRRLPEKLPGELVDAIAKRSDVLPVPLRFDSAGQGEATGRRANAAQSSRPLQLVWNHRWEYDKGPEYLLAFAKVLARGERPVVLHVVGQSFRDRPPAFAQLRALLEDPQRRGVLRCGEWGHIASRSEYLALLARCDCVISTALHDFQGLAVLAACAAGCAPLLPDRLAYPEMFAPNWLYPWVDDPDENALAMHSALKRIVDGLGGGSPLPNLDAFRWPALARTYREKIGCVQ